MHATIVAPQATYTLLRQPIVSVLPSRRRRKSHSAKTANIANRTTAATWWITPVVRVHHASGGTSAGAAVGKNATTSAATPAVMATPRSALWYSLSKPRYVKRKSASATNMPTKAATAPV